MQQLCEICERIPFKSLPTLPKNFAIFTPEGPKKTIFRSRIQDVKPEEDASTQIDPLSSPELEFEKDIDDIHASAASCPICKLLSEGLQSLAADHEEAMQDPKFSYYEIKGAGGPSKDRLRLIAREDGGDGFLVMVKAKREKYWYHVAAIGLCTLADDPLADIFPGRPIEADPGGEAGMATIVQWTADCDRGHDKCKADSDHEMPTRVLDLGDSLEDHVKLIETVGLLEPYVTLSHCWGDSGHFITTQSSLADHQQCINLQDLPKTFQDAVQITRKLGQRYLWIDSICILQDDLADWERQSARMASVYSNSYLTIAADAAKDNSIGCFVPRTHTYHSFPYTNPDGRSGVLQCAALPLRKAQWPHGWLEMREEPLNDRGWALQERSLAPRVLHYANDQMYYECNQSFRSEDGVTVRGRFGQKGIQIEDKWNPDERTNIESWANVLWSYTMRKLSKLDDRLPALSGLARIFQGQFDDEYVAGLWKSHLHGELLWQAVGGARRSKPAESYRGPSWSWVSVDGLIGGTGHRHEAGDWKPIAEILDVHVELKGENPFGEIKDAWLKIKGSKIPLRMSDEPEHDADHVPHKRVIRVTTEWGNQYGEYTLLDTWDWRDPVEVERFKRLETFVLPLIRYRPERKVEGSDEPGYQGLIITRDENRPEAYRRLGVLIFDHDITGSADLLADQRFVEEILLV